MKTLFQEKGMGEGAFLASGTEIIPELLKKLSSKCFRRDNSSTDDYLLCRTAHLEV